MYKGCIVLSAHFYIEVEFLKKLKNVKEKKDAVFFNLEGSKLADSEWRFSYLIPSIFRRFQPIPGS